jgi:aspartate aminotransferase-like enzyme
MTPGPTRVPERVLKAGARPMIHHRSPEFSRELAEILELIAPVFGTRTKILPLHSTGRGAMEGAICNLFSPGDEIAVGCNGKFGELWARLAEVHGLVVHRLSTDWSRDLDLSALEQLLDDRRSVRGVAVTYCDTSTGARHDIEAVSRIARRHAALTLVDGVSAIGGMPFAFDAWDVDVAVTASQKCLMSSPGVAFAAVSDRAWDARTRSTLPHGYWDFAEIRECISKPKPATPGTPPVHAMLQVAEALRMMHEEGLDRVYARHDAMAACARERAASRGLSMQCPLISTFASTVTAIALPAGIKPTVLRETLRRSGIETAEALGPFGNHALRVGHMGDIRVADVERTFDALKHALAATVRP